MYLKQIGINTRNWVNSAEDRIIKSPCECGSEPPGSINHRGIWLVCFILVIKESIKILVLWYKDVTAVWFSIF